MKRRNSARTVKPPTSKKVVDLPKKAKSFILRKNAGLKEISSDGNSTADRLQATAPIKVDDNSTAV